MPNVLVHGGGFAGSCWDLLVPELDAPSVAVDLNHGRFWDLVTDALIRIGDPVTETAGAAATVAETVTVGAGRIN